jgi:translation elongation factor EF-G
VYSGILKAKSNVFNASKGIIEKTSNLYRVRAGDYVNINEIVAGDIAAI